MLAKHKIGLKNELWGILLSFFEINTETQK